MDTAAIGIFDSGFGGLTVARAVVDALPGESILYLGDTANAPYGPRPVAQVRALALAALDRLADEGVKMLVIACNSASSAVLHDARERYEVGAGIPVVEVIHPTARGAAAATRSGRVGVVGTRATIESGAYGDAFAAAPHISLTVRACPRLVEFVEAGRTDGPEVISQVREYLDPIRDAGVDTLILGCTHYPLLEGVIAEVMGEGVTLVTSGPETARDVAAALEGVGRRPEGAAPTHRWLTTGDPVEFGPLARRFIGGTAGLWTMAAPLDSFIVPSRGGGPQ
ncbi:MAG: glutamate racemase [Bifidobacteriaceae bacterium]|jgi:glutamate racemase|nr:glutamate racemase [Bifidobacteriaceae bacterium]